MHPAAPHHLPSFITAPGHTDVLMVITTVFLVTVLLLVGVFLFRLHMLPEQIAHKSKKVQYDVVAVLGLLGLFTMEHVFWISALLIAVIDIPDFASPLSRIARALEKMVGTKRGQPVLVAQPGDTAEELPDLKTGTTRS